MICDWPSSSLICLGMVGLGCFVSKYSFEHIVSLFSRFTSSYCPAGLKYLILTPVVIHSPFKKTLKPCLSLLVISFCQVIKTYRETFFSFIIAYCCIVHQFKARISHAPIYSQTVPFTSTVIHYCFFHIIKGAKSEPDVPLCMLLTVFLIFSYIFILTEYLQTRSIAKLLLRLWFSTLSDFSLISLSP